MIIKDSDRETHLERWLEIRRGGLTATEAGAIAAGKKTIGGVWADKKSGKKVPSNPFMEWGNMMEPHILDWLRMELDNTTVVANSHIVAWDEDTRCLATPDGFTDGAVVECKTTGKDWPMLHGASVLVPMSECFKRCGILHYYYQCQWQMLVCDVNTCYFVWNVRKLAPVAVQKGLQFTIAGVPVSDPILLFTPGAFDYVVVERDDAVIESLLKYRDDFFSDGAVGDPVVPDEAIECMRRARALDALARALREKANRLVTDVLAPGDKVSGEWGSVSCSERKTTRVDTNKLKFEHPELFSKYSSESTSTQIRFTLKED